MRLIRLEAKGFKSFGDKISIRFDDGITSVVGPNGCGKSNIVDAIRWVLGEQSTRNLRSDKMSNIIFNGTSQRKQASTAEVSLVFQNDKNLLPPEFGEVTIGRKYHISGKSEYLLNNEPVRRRDISELFMNTGISSNSYAIIELRMVDEILNDRDGSRKELFEEAAGIAKFKARKKETQRKLQSTHEDLERVEDLLHEIAKNMRSLERQAKQAKKHKDTKEFYRKLSVTLAKRQIRESSQEFDDVSEKVKHESESKDNLKERLEERNEHLEELRKEANEKEQILAGKRNQLSQGFQKIRQAENDLKLQQERSKYLTEKQDNLGWQISQAAKEKENALENLKSLEEQKENTAARIQNEEEALENLREHFEAYKEEIAVRKRQTEQAAAAGRELQNQIFLLNKDVEIKQTKINAFQQELENLFREDSEQAAQADTLEAELQNAQHRIGERRERMKVLKNEQVRLEQEIENTLQDIEKRKEALSGLNRNLDAKKSEHRLTKSLVDNMEGFSKSVKFLNKYEAWGADSVLFSEIIQPQAEYRESLSAYLEPFTNSFIVQTAAEAKEAVQLLKKEDQGRAQFFILDDFKNFIPEKAQTPKGATPAVSLVSYEEKYRDLVHFLLHNVFILEEEKSDISPNDSAVFLNKEGSLIRRKGSLTGGVFTAADAGILGRKQQLEKLAEEVEALSTEVQKAETELQAVHEHIKELRESSKAREITELQQQLDEMLRQEAVLRTRREEAQKLRRAAEEKKEDLQEKMYIIREDLQEIKPRTEEKEAELKEKEREYRSLSEELEDAELMLNEKSQTFNSKNLSFHQLKNKLENIENEIQYKKESAEKSGAKIEQSEKDLEQAKEEILNATKEKQRLNRELETLYEQKEVFQEEVRIHEDGYYESKEQITSAEKEIKEIQLQRENGSARVLALQKHLNEINLKLNSVKERLSAEFDIELNQQAIFEPDDEELENMPEPEIRQEIATAKEILRKIGNVNLMAVEAFEEVSKRHDFITEQRQDLFEGMESLQKTIAEIEQMARDTFLSAFEQIRENFQNVFRSLFSEEDRCDLILSDPSDPLESKIDIIAQPKGKRPLSIKQLSGGEKTLTAISLLFAIYLLRPAPFCVFDEVDAPLDDANIDKFNRIIKKFNEDVQFIIVTHNKRTMANTDVIYGVTMEEQGVSKITPIDLKSLELA